MSVLQLPPQNDMELIRVEGSPKFFDYLFDHHYKRGYAQATADIEHYKEIIEMMCLDAQERHVRGV